MMDSDHQVKPTWLQATKGTAIAAVPLFFVAMFVGDRIGGLLLLADGALILFAGSVILFDLGSVGSYFSAPFLRNRTEGAAPNSKLRRVSNGLPIVLAGIAAVMAGLLVATGQWSIT